MLATRGRSGAGAVPRTFVLRAFASIVPLDARRHNVRHCQSGTMADNERRSGPEVSKSDKRKQSLYFPEAMLDEIQKEAQRLQRSMSWVVQRAWKHARREIKSLPGSNEPET
jgi:uncharacterized small protein (TIGR04563 family)